MTVRANLGPLAVTSFLMAAALALAWQQMAPFSLLPPSGRGLGIDETVFYYSVLPRMATALLCGAALALSGALFQQILRNPLASPTTLGISAGANLALVATMLAVPGLLGVGRDLVALGGSGVAAGLVFLLGARRGFSPFALVMSGLVVSLWCGALSAVLMLLNERYLVSLFIWGAGSLSQQSWAIPLSLLPKLLVGLTLALLILRPLAINELGDAGATALGLKTAQLRILAIAIAVALAAFVTSAVGVIGFIGLVSPTIARLAGARRPAALLVWSTLIGASLLFLTDRALMLLSSGSGDLLPTGAVTAIFGSPLLLVLLPRLKTRHRMIEATGRRASALATQAWLPTMIGLTLVVLCLVLLFGRTPDLGWALLAPDLWSEILPLRLPRIVAAFASGAMLAAAGIIMQRLTGNEMASPELLGISAGATLGVAVGVFIVGTPGLFGQLGFAAGGGLLVLGLIFLLSMRSGLAPERVLLAGIALSAMVDAVVGVIGASGDPRAIFLLRWMSGSTYTITLEGAALSVTAALVLILLCFMARRWLDLLPLGPSAATALGMQLQRSRILLLVLAGLLSAVATMCVGPLSFVGLMAPHLATQLGLLRARSQLWGGVACGGMLMVLADWLGRSLIYPYEIPAGLVSALIGAPFLVLLMRRAR